jgi:hypothetical protein
MLKRGQQLKENRSSTSAAAKRRKVEGKDGSNKLTYNDYTVGWVCALPKELIAATAMLNKTHTDLLR